MTTSLLIDGADQTDAMILRVLSTLRMPAAVIGTSEPLRRTVHATHLTVREIDIDIFGALDAVVPAADLEGGHLVLSLCDPDDSATVRRRWGAPLSPRSLLIRLLRIIDTAYERMVPRSIVVVLRPDRSGDEDRAAVWLGWLENLVDSWASRTGRKVPFNTVVVSPDREMDATAAARISHLLSPDQQHAPATIGRAERGAAQLHTGQRGLAASEGSTMPPYDWPVSST